MAVYDQWHKAPGPGDKPCSCGTAKNPLYPSSRHQVGKRWQVRWHDPTGKVKQPKRNFDLKVGKNPEIHADAYDKQIQASIDNGTYTSPADAEITFQEYAEQWREGRKYKENRAAQVESKLRCHVYQAEGEKGRTPKGGVSIGQRKIRELARRPSLIQAWINAIPLAESSAGKVVDVVSWIFDAAVDDGIANRNPVKAKSVDRPGAGKVKARPWPRAHVEAMARELPERIRIVPWLGAGTGMRQGEMLGLGAEDIRFLGRDPRISVVRQLKYVRGRPYFAPVKNGKEHSPPLSKLLAERLARHMELYPPVAVTLPWYDPDDKVRHGQPVTVRLVITNSVPRQWNKSVFSARWVSALYRAGILQHPEKEGEPEPSAQQDGCHALRHTAASAWLRSGIDVVRVASWLGDTPAEIWKTYAHLMPHKDDDDGRAAIDRLLAPEPEPGPESCAPDVPPAAANGR